MATYLPNVQVARQELHRMHTIRAWLATQIANLQQVKDYGSLEDTWVKIYKSRLKDNVWPVIRECEAYIESASV